MESNRFVNPISTTVTGQQTYHLEPRRKCCAGGCSVWCRKYFWEGQQLSSAHASKLEDVNFKNLPFHKRFLLKQRKLIGLITPALFVHFFWWGVMIEYNLWHLFRDKYFMSITMIFGSMVAGLTSEGGGAVAFPVMTLGFGIKPSVARDFSMMIQSVGMSCASIALIIMKVQLEWHSIIFCSLGGMGGMIFGLHMIDPLLSPSQKKILFVSIWFSFASVLLFLNRRHKRTTYDKIVDFKIWKGVLLIITGFVGGGFTSFAGSGLDICSFSILTLLFRISEKVATPTSVVLMAGNSLVGFYWRGVMLQGIDPLAWDFLIVCVPVVVFGAPLGSVIGSHFHRLVLAALVIIIDLVALIGAYSIVKLSPTLIGTSIGIIVGGSVFFWLVSYFGEKIMVSYEKRQSPGEVTSSGQPVVQSNFSISGGANETHQKGVNTPTHADNLGYNHQPQLESFHPMVSPPATDVVDLITIRGELYALVKPIVVSGNLTPLANVPPPDTTRVKHVIKVGHSNPHAEAGNGIAKSSYMDDSWL